MQCGTFRALKVLQYRCSLLTLADLRRTAVRRILVLLCFPVPRFAFDAILTSQRRETGAIWEPIWRARCRTLMFVSLEGHTKQ